MVSVAYKAHPFPPLFANYGVFRLNNLFAVSKRRNNIIGHTKILGPGKHNINNSKPRISSTELRETSDLDKISEDCAILKNSG